jgi:reactive intermediate/imine deaminase
MSELVGAIVPGLPHPLLVPDGDPSWRAIADAFQALRERIEASSIERLLLYSTGWPSVIGHQVQADPQPEWVHVDPEFHHLGRMPYRFRIDRTFSERYVACAKARGLHARAIAYRGFPIDTGSVVALRLLNPDNRLPASIVSCNMYADRTETVVLGKAARDAIDVPTLAIAVTQLSNRLHTAPVARDHVSSAQDDEWNKKLLQFLTDGRVEDVAQLARTFAAQAHADSKFKAMWWLSAVLGQHNRFRGEVLAYGPIAGAGAAVVVLSAAEDALGDQEFDEEGVEVFAGERAVLSGANTPAVREVVHSAAAPAPVGAYPHARRVGELLYLSGVGPRQPGSNLIPGGDTTSGNYDIRAQTRAVIDNVRAILQDAGASMQQVVDVTVFLIDMKRDFAAFNEVYAETFAAVQATRTTLQVGALPTPIAVEFKVIARM